MCVKCGINSCGGCNSKDLNSEFTGDVVYDGPDFDCWDDSLDVTSGDGLNSILAKLLPAACLASEKPYINRELLGTNVPDANALDLGTPFTAPRDGDYHVRLIVRAQMSNEVTGNIFLYKITSPSGVAIGTETVTCQDAGATAGQVLSRSSVVMEDIITLSAGDQLTSRVSGKTGAGSMLIDFSTIYAKRIS